VNFCKFTTRRATRFEDARQLVANYIEASETDRGAGGGTSWHLATDYILMADDGATRVSLTRSYRCLAVMRGTGVDPAGGQAGVRARFARISFAPPKEGNARASAPLNGGWWRNGARKKMIFEAGESKGGGISRSGPAATKESAESRDADQVL